MPASKRATKLSAAATFHDHLKELRSRLFVVVIVFIVAMSVAYSYKDVLLDVLMRPLGGEKLIYLTPAGGFSFIFQVSIYVGLAATVPVLIYNLFRFIAPVLARRTRLSSIIVMLASVVLLGLGVSFGYFYAIPAAMNFLIHFADGYVSASLTAESYLGFVMAYTAGLALLFQLPLLMLFAHWIHPLKPLGLFKFERYMILLVFIVAAIISPTPDVLNQTILAAPIILMYQIGVIAVWVSVRRANKRAAKPTLTKAMKRARAREVEAPRTVAPAIPLAQVKRTGESYANPIKKASVGVRSIDGMRPGTQPKKPVASSRKKPVVAMTIDTPKVSPVVPSVAPPVVTTVIDKVLDQPRPPRSQVVHVPPARSSDPAGVMRSYQSSRSTGPILHMPNRLDDSAI